MLFGQSNSEIYRQLSEYVSGHDEAKKALIALLNRSKMRYTQRWGKEMHKDYLLQTSKVLLIGASGTGKTHLVESLSQIVQFPLLKLDATKLNPTGASGGVKEEDLRKMIVDNAKICFERSPSVYFSIDGAVDQTVVFIDEIDKLGDSFDSSGKWNDHVQSNFLTMFDNKSEFAGVSFVFAGAFTSITNSEKISSSIGFMRDEKQTSNKDSLEERIVKAGLLPEIVGRMTAIVQLDNFTKDEYRSILLERLLPKKQQDLAHFGVFDVDLDDEKVEEIIDIAVGSNQGVRSLQRQLDKIFLDIEFNYEEDRTRKLTLGE
jgi:ATP-dependent Clp protease ATP-binding subunit ClpX